MSARRVWFTATYVSSYDEGDTFVLGIASDSSAEPEHGIIMQIGRSSDPQDAELGLFGPYIELTPAGYRGYNVISRCSLRERSLRVEFRADAAGSFGGLESAEVALELDPSSRTTLEHSLRRIFAGCDYYQHAV